MSEPDRSPSNPARVPAARDAQRWARAERERRVVEGLNGGLAMAEIARREGISVRGLRKYGAGRAKANLASARPSVALER